MNAAVQNGLVALRMLASPLLMVCSPQAIAIQGMTALPMPITAKGTRRSRNLPANSDRPDSLMITASAIAPEADLTKTRTVGLMSWTPSLKNRKDKPQIRPSVTSAR